MQVRAVRTLCARSLAPGEIDATLAFMLAVEVARVAAGTAWLAETPAGRVVAGTAFVPQGEDILVGLLAKPLSPLPAHYGLAARLCGTCVDPDFARRGLARLMIRTAEADMASAGFGVAEVLTTLDAEPLWLAAGFVAIEDHSVLLPACAAAALALRRLARPLLAPATPRQSRGRRSEPIPAPAPLPTAGSCAWQPGPSAQWMA
jgi:hypothetical protein